MPPALATTAARLVALTGGLAFVASLLYFVVSYMWRFDAPADEASASIAAAGNTILFSLFAMHHSLFARTGVKAWMRRTLPAALERSTYVWISSALFVAVCALWLPVAGALWHVEGAGRAAMLARQAAAGVFTVVAARRLDVLDLAGIRQVFEPSRRDHRLDDTGPYRLVRHPIYLAWIAFVLLAPTMNGTRLVFAVVSSAYLLIAIPFEERDLHRGFGAAYAAYTRRVRWRVLPYIF
jgi:protein-S-isoprenylcysteine O-methyltransferase Ste14